MKNCLFFFIIIMCATLSFASNIKKVVHVGAYQNPPLIFKDKKGEIVGIFADVLYYVAEKENWEIKWNYDEWNASLTNLQNGQIDLQAVIAFSEKRDEIYDFNKITTIENWGIVYQPQESDIQSVVNLDNKRIALLPNDIHSQIFKKVAKEKGIQFTIVEVKKYSDIFKLLSDKKVDAGIVNRFFGIKNEKKYNIKKTPVFFNPIKVQYASAENKKTNLLNAIDKHLQILKADKNSAYYRSLNKWLLTKEVSWWKSVAILKWMGAFIIFMIFIFIIWISLIKKSKE